MIEQVEPGNVLFLDIETVSDKPTYDDLNETFQELWRIKSKSVRRSAEEADDAEIAASYKDRAAIFAEFGRIICISVGSLRREKESGKLTLRLTSFYGHDEKVLLEDFSRLIQQHYGDPNKHSLCGHNIREFDIPYICRRMVVHQLPFPAMLNLSGKKPWETKHLLDTMELWKFGDGKNYTSLKLLAAVLGFPSPKDDIDGSDVGRVYWEENDIERIATYCEKDVLATVQLFLRFRRAPLLEEGQVSFVRQS
jgi:DNA polymerase elongation subunit (family B)